MAQKVLCNAELNEKKERKSKRHEAKNDFCGDRRRNCCYFFPSVHNLLFNALNDENAQIFTQHT
jgi:hypothetical protein